MFALIWSSAFAFSLHTGIFLPQLFAAIGFGTVLVGLIAKKLSMPARHPVWLVLAGAVLIQVLSALFSGDAGHSLSTVGRYYALPIIGAFNLLVLLRDQKSINVTATAFLIGAAFGGAVGLFQIFAGFDPIYGQHITGPDPAVTWIDMYVPRGLLNMPLTYAGVQMMAVVFCLPWLIKYRGKRKAWLWALYVVVVLSLLLAGKRSPWLGGMAGVGMYFLTRGRKVAIIMILAAILGGSGLYVISSGFRARVLNTVQLRTNSESDRIYLWQSALKMMGDHPVLGVGPGMWPRYIDQYLPEKDYSKWIVRVNHETGEIECKAWYSKAHAHSDPIMLLATTGILGLLSIASIVFLLLEVGVLELRLVMLTDMKRIYMGSLLVLVSFMAASSIQCYLSDGEDALTLLFLLGLGLSGRQLMIIEKVKDTALDTKEV